MLRMGMLILAVLSVACNNSEFGGDGAKKKPPSSATGDDVTGGDAGGNPSDHPLGGDTQEALSNLPGFGLMVNNLQCGMCHVKVHGDVISTRTVTPVSPISKGVVEGDWHVNGAFQAGLGISVTGQVYENSTANVPKVFPSLNFTKIRGYTAGKISSPQMIDKQHIGNLLLLGSDASPINIHGDIYVEGDLIIAGPYRGIGTIYATGNIYVPFDLRAIDSPFPYDRNKTSALSQAASRMNKDGLGLAAQGSILVGDIEMRGFGGLGGGPSGIFPNDKDKVYQWYDKSKYEQLYKNAIHCSTQTVTADHSVNVVDAFLYAKQYVAGINRHASFSVRGGLIADTLHILNIMGTQAKNNCSSQTNAIHGRESNFSHVEYDYRLATGKMRILEYLGKQIADDKK